MSGERSNAMMNRRTFLGVSAGGAVSMGVMLAGCEAAETSQEDTAEVVLKELPAPQPDPESQFGVDLNINMKTIDEYVGRDDIVYRDVRMVCDTADFGSIGGNPDLATTIKGFKIAPYPLIGTLLPLPVEGQYEGRSLFTVEWGEEHDIISVEPNYEHSMLMIEEMFPKDMPIFLMCGGGGYAYEMRILLTYLGWDPQKLYHVGANWDYDGDFGVELVTYDVYNIPTFFLWRAERFIIDFESLEDQALLQYQDAAGLLTTPGTGVRRSTSTGKECTSGF